MLDLKPYRPVIRLLSDTRLRTITGAIIYMRLTSDLKLQEDTCVMMVSDRTNGQSPVFDQVIIE